MVSSAINLWEDIEKSETISKEKEIDSLFESKQLMRYTKEITENKTSFKNHENSFQKQNNQSKQSFINLINLTSKTKAY